LLYIAFLPKRIYHFAKLGRKIAATFPRLVVTAMSGGLVIFTFLCEFFLLVNKP